MRHPFLRTVMLCTALSASLFLAACGAESGKAEPTPPPADIEIVPEEAPAQAHSTKYKDGIYTSGRKGYGGDVVVSATIANDEIIELEIEGAEETKGVGSIAIERMHDRILEAQFQKADGVSGATVTSDAIKAALEDILRKAEY